MCDGDAFNTLLIRQVTRCEMNVPSSVERVFCGNQLQIKWWRAAREHYSFSTQPPPNSDDVTIYIGLHFILHASYAVSSIMMVSELNLFNNSHDSPAQTVII